MTNRRHARFQPQLIVWLCLLPLSAARAQLRVTVPELSWRAPRGCPSQEEVLAALPRTAQAAGLQIEAVVERSGAGYRLRLRVQGAGQSFERELRSGTCAVLAESTSWLVQLAATRLSTASTPEPAPDASSPATSSAEAPANAVSSSLVAAESADEVAPAVHLNAGPPETTNVDPHRLAAVSGGSREREGAHFQVGLGAAATDLGFRGLSPHLALDLAVALADWRLGVRLGVLLHPEITVADDAAVDLRTDAAQVFGCRLWALQAARVGPCITLSALRSVAHTRGLTGRDDEAASWLAAGPGVTLQLRIAQAVLVHLELGAWAALTPRPSFEVSDSTLARAGTLAGYARLGAGYELW